MDSYSSTSLRDKTRFFRQLEAIDRLCGGEDAGDDEFQETEERLRQQLRVFQAVAKPRQPFQERSQKEPQLLSVAQQTTIDLRRSASVPIPASPLQELKRKDPVIKRTPLAEIRGPGRKDRDFAPAADTSVIEDTPIPDSSSRPPLQPTSARTRSATTPLPANVHLLPHRMDNSPSITAMKKRKRDSLTKTVPVELQMFRDLRFHFIPNDDVAPARKIRIRKAQEFGATWTRSLTDATHIIVDRNLTWKNIESILCSQERLPACIVVNEDYPLDCVRFKALLNADQKQYVVSGCTGQPSALADPQRRQHTAPATLASRDLPLKSRQTNPKKWDYVPPPPTPARSQESSGSRSNTRSNEPHSVLRDITPIRQPCTVHSTWSQVVDESDQEDLSTMAEKPATSTEDELEDAISQMRQFRDLPLDHDEEDGLPYSSRPIDEELDDQANSEDEQRRKKRAVAKTMGRKDMTWEDKFACHKGGTKGSDEQNPNNRTIEVLQQMCDYYTRTNDTWRPIAYRKAITQLKRQPTKISTADEAVRLPGVGQRLADKIEEIVWTNRLRRLEHAESEPMDEVLQTFLKIYGVGSVQASHWIAQGFRTLEDLREKARLSTNQRIGVDHYDDLNTRIPRAEVKLLGAVVRSEAAKLDPAIQIIIGGSYRRGADNSGDVDFLVTKKGTKSTAELVSFLNGLVEMLTAQNFLVARLAASRDEGDGNKWHGCCVLPRIKGFNDHNYRKVWRRVDFLLVPETEIGAALLYFTGNDIFNRSIRLLASKKGMRLNQRGLYKDVIRGPGRVKLTEGELVEGQDERKIFEILGVKWREPHERWC